MFFIVQTGCTHSNVFRTADKVAIKGYDVVAYHHLKKAVKGDKKHAFTYNETQYYFHSAANKKAFKKNPNAYLPQYGGYCAFALAAKNQKVPVNPNTFKLVVCIFFLFFNDMYQGKRMNTRVFWNKDEQSMLVKANKNWSVMTTRLKNK